MKAVLKGAPKYPKYPLLKTIRAILRGTVEVLEGSGRSDVASRVQTLQHPRFGAEVAVNRRPGRVQYRGLNNYNRVPLKRTIRTTIRAILRM